LASLLNPIQPSHTAQKLVIMRELKQDKRRTSLNLHRKKQLQKLLSKPLKTRRGKTLPMLWLH
jgi:hypothetical protein